MKKKKRLRNEIFANHVLVARLTEAISEYLMEGQKELCFCVLARCRLGKVQPEAGQSLEGVKISVPGNLAFPP